MEDDSIPFWNGSFFWVTFVNFQRSTVFSLKGELLSTAQQLLSPRGRFFLSFQDRPGIDGTLRLSLSSLSPFFVIMFLEYHFLVHIFMVIMHWCFLFLHKTNKNTHLMDTQQTVFQLLFTPLCVWLFSMNGGPLSYPHLHFQALRQVKKRTLKCSWRNAKPFEPWSDWPNRLNWKAAGWWVFGYGLALSRWTWPPN